MKQNIWLKLAISLIAIGFVIIRFVWPDLKIDSITIGLFIVALLPWLSTLIESAKFPGGWEIKFRDIQSAGKKVMGEDSKHLAKVESRPSYLEISDHDPNLALVGLRIEIEKRLRALAAKYQIKEQRSIMRMFDELRQLEILNSSAISGLQELIMAGNQAAHGAKVEPNAAQWAFDYGPAVLAALDEKLNTKN